MGRMKEKLNEGIQTNKKTRTPTWFKEIVLMPLFFK